MRTHMWHLGHAPAPLQQCWGCAGVCRLEYVVLRTTGVAGSSSSNVSSTSTRLNSSAAHYSIGRIVIRRLTAAEALVECLRFLFEINFPYFENRFQIVI
jgi:hypothetical protein